MALGALNTLAPSAAGMAQPPSQPAASAVGAATYADPSDDIDLEAHLRMVVGYFEESEDMSFDERRASEQCRDYHDGKQWTSAEMATLARRGQAPTVDNQIQRKIQSLCGLERRTRTDPKAFPRNPDDQQDSDAATDALRYVVEKAKFNATRSKVYEEILVEATGGAEVTIDEQTQDLKIKRVPWDRLWWDRHSRELNFEDAAYKGIVIWMDVKQAIEKWPHAEQFIRDTITTTSLSNTYDDRPRHTWTDSRRKRVRIVQCHYLWREEWWVATYVRGGFVEEPALSPYKNEDGSTRCNLILRSGFVDRENNRFSHCASLLSLQDEINKRRSKALHLLSSRQTYGNKQGISDVAAAKKELAKPDGHVEINAGAKFGEDFGVLPTGDMAQGQFQMLEQAQAAMNATGANSAVQGKDERTQSGIALKTRIQAGAVELEPQSDGLREWTQEVMEAAWLCLRQFWTAEKWVRVTDDDRNVKFVGLNKQITLGDQLKQLAQSDPQAAQQFAQDNGITSPFDPRLRQVVKTENKVSGLDVDIIIDQGPDIASLQSEQFGELVQLAGMPFMNGPSGPAISPIVILKASSLRNKDALIEEQEKHMQAAQQSGQQGQGAQQQAAQLGAAKAAADIEKTKADAIKAQASAALDQAKTQQIQIDSHITGVGAIEQAAMGTPLSGPPPVPPQPQPQGPDQGFQAPQGPMQ
jgi:hypothetical protein